MMINGSHSTIGFSFAVNSTASIFALGGIVMIIIEYASEVTGLIPWVITCFILSFLLQIAGFMFGRH